MAWTLLPTDYTDAVWSGLKKYNQINNSDGTVSLQDVTVYTCKENSFFGAKDANRMNEALNYIMSMLENGTDLYEEFTAYFATQKKLFETSGAEKEQEFAEYIESLKTSADNANEEYVGYIESLEQEGVSLIDSLKKDYRSEITDFEAEQESLFNLWFSMMKDQLSKDAAGNLQLQLNELSANKAVKSTVVQTTLTTAKWLGEEAPYVQTITVDGLGAETNGNLTLSQNATAEQKEVAGLAMLSVSGQADSTLTITADGIKPEIDIPVSIILLG